MSTFARLCAACLSVKPTADFRLREHCGRNVGVIDPRRHAAVNAVGKRMTLADRDRRQIDPIGNVAHRVNARHAGPRKLIDRDTAVLRELDPDLFQTQPADVRLAAGGKHGLIDNEAFLVRELEGEAMLDFLDTGNDLSRDDLDAATLHFRAQMLAHIVVKAA